MVPVDEELEEQLVEPAPDRLGVGQENLPLVGVALRR